MEKSRSMSVAVVSIAWGDQYSQYAERWWDMVQRLDPKPDEVIIAHHPEDPTGVQDLPVTLVECFDRSLPRMLNAAISASRSDWIQQCPLDDFLMPNALEAVARVKPSTNLIIVGAQSLETGNIWMGDFGSIWGPPSDYRMNHHCPIRRDLWERVGGFGDEHWCDWGFFLRAAKAGCVFEHVDMVTLGFDDTHGGRYSNLGGAAADEEIRQLQAEIRR
jgi:hypothetical protein